MCVRTIKKAGVSRLLISNAVIKLSPAYHSVFNFYMSHALFFTPIEFSLKTFVAETFLFIGIIAINTIFKNVSRGLFLKATGSMYVTTSILLIPLLYILTLRPEIPAIAMVLVYTSLHALFFEIFTLPIVSIFLEICPKDVEGFFMSLISFLNNFAKHLSILLGSLCVFILQNEKARLANLSIIILIHFVVAMTGLCILFISHIPEPKEQAKKGEEPLTEKSYLAYIKCQDSIIIDDLNKKGMTDTALLTSQPAISSINIDQELGKGQVTIPPKQNNEQESFSLH